MINREVVGGTLNVTTSATTVTTDTMENYSEAEAKYELSTKSSVPSISKLPTEVSDVKGTESLDVVADDTKAGEDDFDYYDEIRPVTEPSVYDSGLSSASQVGTIIIRKIRLYIYRWQFFKYIIRN